MANIVLMDISKTKELARIHALCFEVGWDAQAFHSLFQGFGALAWGAYVEGNLCGFIFARIVYDDAEILTFCVLPEKQNQGIGGQLIQALQIHAKETGVKTIFLEVAVNNQPALHLYNNRGFSQVNVRQNYYQSSKISPVDAIVLQFIC